MTEDGRSFREVRRRIALGQAAFNKKRDLMKKSLSLHLQKRMVKVVLYEKRIFGDLVEKLNSLNSVYGRHRATKTAKIKRVVLLRITLTFGHCDGR